MGNVWRLECLLSGWESGLRGWAGWLGAGLCEPYNLLNVLLVLNVLNCLECCKCFKCLLTDWAAGSPRRPGI